MYVVEWDLQEWDGRAPQGARGLKWLTDSEEVEELRSRPARGAWVEIFLPLYELGSYDRRAPQGARGLKSYQLHSCEHTT